MENIQPSSVQKQDDEIDLIELIKILWKKKVWIILFTVIFTILAAIYAFTAKERWTSRAEVIEPNATDLGTYFNIRKEYARILGVEFDINALTKNIFDKFNLVSESLDERRKFFEQSDLYKKLSEGKDEQVKRVILSDLISKNLSVVRPDPKKEPNAIGRRISFFAETPREAQDTLQKFITFIDQSAFQLELADFVTNLDEVISDLNYEKTKFERDLNIQRKVQLDNLHNALHIAKEAGIKDYMKPFGAPIDSGLQALALLESKVTVSDSKLSDGTYLFMLGERYLQAQIDVITQESIIYPPRYYQVIELSKELEPLLTKTKEAKAQAFSYQASPDYPVVKDKPKKAIILILGMLLGVVLSSFFILVLNLFRK
ncbi:MAG: Wzz/FepE/Etk N-terminal domain-containing protein [[Pasteurella] mairii]|uniref:Lipopolysaccharide biosynthesis protein wzzE n=1 Tax=[Pasteurella] mairii TaxID=757 RepID=A0A379B2M2_9PAST|nr:Wzz/FepE/Etk N-terminal domain-containing protein [[Pasteurella] mairii]SUB32751.1 Lipopolysaccharide biosynthesis protein wzzE [[Pasteurella] mairii]